MTMSGSSTAKKTEITTISIRVVLFASRCLLFSLRMVKFTTMRVAVMMIDDLYIIGRFCVSVTKNDHFAQRSQIKYLRGSNFFF